MMEGGIVLVIAGSGPDFGIQEQVFARPENDTLPSLRHLAIHQPAKPILWLSKFPPSGQPPGEVLPTIGSGKIRVTCKISDHHFRCGSDIQRLYKGRLMIA